MPDERALHYECGPNYEMDLIEALAKIDGAVANRKPSVELWKCEGVALAHRLALAEAEAAATQALLSEVTRDRDELRKELENAI